MRLHAASLALAPRVRCTLIVDAQDRKRKKKGGLCVTVWGIVLVNFVVLLIN